MAKRTGKNQRALSAFLKSNGNENYTVKSLAEKLGLTYAITYQSVKSMAVRGEVQFVDGVVSAVGSAPTTQ